MRSAAATPREYLESLPPDRKRAIEKLRKALKGNLPKGFSERMEGGMLAYVVPHSLYPDGYHCNPEQPLPFISLASQKNYVALYHMGLYGGPLLAWFTKNWNERVEAKLDLGKSCLRLHEPEQVPFELIGELAQRVTPEQWIAVYEANLGGGQRRKTSKRPTGSAAKTAASASKKAGSAPKKKVRSRRPAQSA